MVCNKNIGIHSASLIRFYKSYVLPILDYGSAVYGSAKDHVLSKLNPVHHAGIRIATGAYRTSPVPSLYVESDIPPLFIRRMKLVMNYVTKISACPLNPAHKNPPPGCSKSFISNNQETAAISLSFSQVRCIRVSPVNL
jgi:hypothetical protein